MMRAAVYHGPRDVRVESIEDPGHPGPGDLLLAPTRAAICGTDSAEYAHGPQMVPLNERHAASGHVGPLVLGHEFVGRVVAVGSEVEGFREGDRVVSGAGVSCGNCEWCRAGRTNLCASYYTLGLNAPGGLAQRVLSPAGICRIVPDSIGDDAAAMTQPLAVAIHALARGGVGPGETLAVIGLGGIGAFVLGAAASRGLRRLIGIDVDPARLQVASSLGADDVIDARSADVAALVQEATGGDGADVVIEASGAPGSPSIAIHAAKRGGRVVIVGLQAKPPEVDLFDAALREVELRTTVAHVCGTDIPASLAVLDSTAIAEKVLDRVIPLERLVEDGLLPLAEGRAAGKIVVEVPA
jgi:(R,R)-butanediol dehydrogenase / meso-butanediol dehydrogenase / diacetyl reductase